MRGRQAAETHTFAVDRPETAVSVERSALADQSIRENVSGVAGDGDEAVDVQQRDGIERVVSRTLTDDGGHQSVI